jgi:hypothetical protein
VRVDREGADDGGRAVGVGAAELAVAGGVQDRAVRQHRQRHRLADLGDALGQGDLLEVGGVDGVGLCGRRAGEGAAECGGDQQQRGAGGSTAQRTTIVH